MLWIYLNCELISHGSERHVPEGAVELVDLTTNKQEILAETKDHILGQLLESLGLRLGDPFSVGWKFALAPRFKLGGKLVKHCPFDARYEPAPFNILGLTVVLSRALRRCGLSRCLRRTLSAPAASDSPTPRPVRSVVLSSASRPFRSALARSEI